MLFFSETNGLIKGSSIVYRDGDGVGEHASKHVGEDVGEDIDESVGKDIDEDVSKDIGKDFGIEDLMLRDSSRAAESSEVGMSDDEVGLVVSRTLR